jgi:hypothetical protein
VSEPPARDGEQTGPRLCEEDAFYGGWPASTGRRNGTLLVRAIVWLGLSATAFSSSRGQL